jgi:hypothetical protein
MLGIEEIESLDAGEHVAVAVDDDERRRIGRGQVCGDQMLQGLRLAMAGAADDVHVLEARLQGDGEGEWRLHERRQWGAAEVDCDHFRRREISAELHGDTAPTL